MNNYNPNITLGIKNKIFSNYIMPSNNTIFNSGKYSGKTFKDVYDNYPEYVNCISTHKYLKNREKIIKEEMEYNKTNKNFKENTKVFSRLNYYYKNGYFNDIERDDAIEITKYLINNKISIKFISFVSQYLELSKIKII